MADPWAPPLLKHPWCNLLWWESTEEHLPTCWKLWAAKEPPYNMVPPESVVWVDLWHVLPETWTELEELMQEETHNLPEKAKDGWRHSTPRPPDVVEIQRCNNVCIEWNKSMPAGTPLQIIGLHIEVGRNVCWIKGNTMLVGKTQHLAGQPGKKRRYCTTLITQIRLSSDAIQM